MTDIVERIRGLRYVHVPVASALFEEAVEEIERLRNGAVQGRETVLLAADEREAIEGMAAYFDTRGDITMQGWGSLLRILLDRLK